MSVERTADERLARRPQYAVLASLGFVMMGSSYWGYCYAIGGVFLLLALIMTITPWLAPLEFGVAWGAGLVALGRHLRGVCQER